MCGYSLHTVEMIDAMSRTTPAGPHGRQMCAYAAAVLAYALLAAVCPPLTWPALGAVLAARIPLCWVGFRRRPGRAEPVGGRSVAVWAGLGALGAAFELG